jgi:ribonucleoside-diphosphate reductase alpha chain
MSNHHKNTSSSFVKTMKKLYNNIDKHGNHNPLVSNEFNQIIQANSKVIEGICDYSRDFFIDYF